VAFFTATFDADGVVAGHQQDRASPGSAEGGVDPGLADLIVVEPEVLELAARDGMAHPAELVSRPRVHTDQQRRVAAFLEEGCVFRPLALHDPFAVGVELFRNQRVERPAFAGTVTVHDDDLRGTGGLRAAYGGIDLFRVEPSAFLVQSLTAGGLLGLDDARDTLHVADDVDPHGRVA
jgi:hypothetical protein